MVKRGEFKETEGIRVNQTQNTLKFVGVKHTQHLFRSIFIYTSLENKIN